MDGLIIRKEWLDLILSGEKTIEVRGHYTSKIRVPIYLLESGTHRVRGTCMIQTVYPISCSDWSTERENHCVDISYHELKQRYKTPHAWVLTNVEAWEDVSYYVYPKGAVIWVKNVEPSDEMADNERLRYGY